jgi:predicted O-methyltransferase YrrM
LSTILVGAIAKHRGITLWTLEHDSEWGARVQSHLDRYALDSVVVYTKPLRDYGAFAWYDPPLQAMPRNFALVICDGPPSSCKGGRYGLAPIMSDNLKTGCVILLDDASRDGEREIARRWEEDLSATTTVLGSDKPYFEMTVRGAMSR